MERDLGVAESGRVSFEEFKGRLRKQLEFIPLPVEMKKLGPSLKQNVSPPGRDFAVEVSLAGRWF